MFAKRATNLVVGQLSLTAHSPPARCMKMWNGLSVPRNGNQEYVRTIVPGSPAELLIRITIRLCTMMMVLMNQ